MAELTEREAVCRCQRGEDSGHSAFRFLYERFAPEILRFEKRLLGERQAAEDATQETFLRLHRGLAGFDPERPLRPYVLQIARNVAIDVLRVRAKRPKSEVLQDEPASGPSAVLDLASASEHRALVEQSLAALAPEHRSILILRWFHGLKLEEIAEGAACTVRTTRNRLRAAAVLLERELKRRGLPSLEVSP